MKFNSLRARFVLATVGIATVPILFLGLAAGIRSANELERQSLALQNELATRVEQNVTAFVSTRLSELRLLERTNQLIGADEESNTATLARLLAHDQVFQAVAILAPDGQIRAFASRTESTPNVPVRWTTAPFVQPGYWDDSNRYVGPIEYSSEVREPLIDIAVPIVERRSGSVDAVLLVRARFTPIWELLADLSLPAETEAYVVGADEQVLAHRSPGTVLAQTVLSLPEGPGRHVLLDGRPGLVVWQPLPLVGGGARVVVTRPFEAALANANEILWTTFAATAVLLVVAAIVALQQARSIVRPIEALARAGQRISDGDLESKIEPSGPEEIETLGAVLGDMTRQLKNTIAQLERSEFAERQRALVTLESIGDAVITTDTEGRVIYANPIAEQLTGWTQAEAEGRPLPEVFRIVDGTTRAVAPNPVDRCLANQEIVELANNTILIRRDGREIMIADSAAPIREMDGSVQGVVLVFRDVTEKKTLESAVRQSQKMEAIGQLTGGIAHDFNNLLQVIQGNAELILDETGSEFADSIIRASKRGGDLTSRLLSFGRRQTLVPVPTELGGLFDGLRSMFSRTIGETYEIKAEVAPDTALAMIDPGQLEAAILNLVLNSRDALPQGGSVLISARNARPEEEAHLNLENGAETSYVVVEVSDNGPGMSPETLDKAIEPFFTTKGVGEGSGLGLSMVYGFVRQSDGLLDIKSELGVGTTVSMYLPRASVGTDRAAPRRPDDGINGQGQTILVVEDDPEVRDQALRSLTSLGYRVVTAQDVADARAALKAHPETDLVLTDVVLPGGESGADLHAELAISRPDLPVCLMSGYPRDDLTHHLGSISAPPLLNKPFSRGELAARIASQLNNDAE